MPIVVSPSNQQGSIMTNTPSHHAPQQPLPVSVQVLSTLLFAAFAIPVTIVALNVFWPAGVAIAGVLAWRGGFAPIQRPQPIGELVAQLSPDAPKRTSGNASFDAYRHDTLDRLEQEQGKFENFLTRLREAKDKTEFDQFLDDRAARVTDKAAA